MTVHKGFGRVSASSLLLMCFDSTGNMKVSKQLFSKIQFKESPAALHRILCYQLSSRMTSQNGLLDYGGRCRAERSSVQELQRAFFSLFHLYTLTLIVCPFMLILGLVPGADYFQLQCLDHVWHTQWQMWSNRPGSAFSSSLMSMLNYWGSENLAKMDKTGRWRNCSET